MHSTAVLYRRYAGTWKWRSEECNHFYCIQRVENDPDQLKTKFCDCCNNQVLIWAAQKDLYISPVLGTILCEHIEISNNNEGFLYHQYDWNFYKMISCMLCLDGRVKDTKNWMLAWNTSCHVSLHFNPVEL